jgi:hypothetical protein
VTATRSGSTFSLTFKASGTPTDAKGRMTYTEPSGYTFSGDVTCYYQQGNMAVMTGRVTEEKPFSTGTTGPILRPEVAAVLFDWLAVLDKPEPAPPMEWLEAIHKSDHSQESWHSERASAA